MKIIYEQLEYLGNREEFAEAIEQVCYSVDGKGIRVIGSEDEQRGLPPRIQAISKALNNLLVGLRSPEILGLFAGSKPEEWHYLSRDQVNIDAIAVSIQWIHDHYLEPPDRPLWRLGSHGVIEGYCIRIPTTDQILSLCLHATKVCTGPTQIVRRVEFRALRRDPHNYSENRNNAYHARRWASQEVIAAVSFNIGPTANGRTAVDAEYYTVVAPFYTFILHELRSVLIQKSPSSVHLAEGKSIPGVDINNVHSALINAFSESELAMLLRTELEVNYTTIAEGQNFADKVFNLLRWAERHGRFAELVCAASTARPKNQILLEYVKKYACSS